MLYYSPMRQTLLILATVACAALTGCFDNHGRPQDATPVTSLAALAATNRAEVVRLYLRGGAEPLAKGALADLPRLRELDLSERALAAVPEEVFALPSLERFWFARNQLAECPAALAKLPALTYLNLDGNRLTAVPEALGDAARLRYLRLNENQLADLPAALGRLKELRRFYAVRNRLTAVPAFLKECPLVEDVILDHNAITEVPAWLTALPAHRHYTVWLRSCAARQA